MDVASALAALPPPSCAGAAEFRRFRWQLYERDRGICRLCGVEVDMAAYRTPFAPTLDHVLPRSQGGDFTPENLQLAHFFCNQMKGSGRAFTADQYRQALLRIAHR